MHIHTRLVRASSAASLGAATAVAIRAVEHINDRHDAGLGAGMQVGGDPLLIGITGSFESLADLEALRNGLQADEEFQEIIRSGDGHFGPEMEDSIWNSRIEAGAPSTYAQVSSANVMLTALSEAMTFAAEVSTTVTAILGRQVGFATAVTGDRSRILWIGHGDSLAQIEADGDQLEQSADYLDLFKRSEGLVVPNTLEQNIWHRITA